MQIFTENTRCQKEQVKGGFYACNVSNIFRVVGTLFLWNRLKTTVLLEWILM